MGKDYYKILGVERSASKEEIKKAYKKKALKFHPDRAPEGKNKEYEEHFKEVNEAAAVLGDDKKKQQYDQYGSDSFAGGAGGFEGFDFSDVFRGGDFGDVFDQLFGGRRGSRARRGSDLLYELEVTLEDVAFGKTQSIALNKLEHCSSCSGKGALKFDTCSHCQGSGQMKRTQRTPFGVFAQTGACPYCKGQGQLPQDSCGSCGGEGLVRKKKNIEVKIPAGIGDGMRLRVAGEGEVGSLGGPSGDLYVEVHIGEHKYLRREGDDLHMSIPISFSQAALGDTVEVPTIDGKAKLKIPAGTASETLLRMQGKGLARLRGSGSGDQLVKVHVVVPTKLSKKQKELIEELGEEKPLKSFLKKLFG